MRILKSKSIAIAIAMLILVVSCEKEKSTVTEKQDLPLTEAQMIEFGISSLEQISSDMIMLNTSGFKSTSEYDNADNYLVHFVDNESQAIIQRKDENKSMLHLLDANNNSIGSFEMVIDKSVNGKATDLTLNLDTGQKIIINKDGIQSFNENELKGSHLGQGSWQACVWFAIESCGKEAGCAIMATLTAPFAFSAIAIACG